MFELYIMFQIRLIYQEIQSTNEPVFMYQRRIQLSRLILIMLILITVDSYRRHSRFL